MSINPNTVFGKPLPISRTREQFEEDYGNLLKAYGTSSKLVAKLFNEAAKCNFPVMDVPCAILSRALASDNRERLLLREVNEFLKHRPAIMACRYIDGGVNTFRPYQLAGILCLVAGATGEEPLVEDYPIQDGADMDTIEKFAYLWCYAPDAYKTTVGGGETR